MVAAQVVDLLEFIVSTHLQEVLSILPESITHYTQVYRSDRDRPSEFVFPSDVISTSKSFPSLSFYVFSSFSISAIHTNLYVAIMFSDLIILLLAALFAAHAVSVPDLPVSPGELSLLVGVDEYGNTRVALVQELEGYVEPGAELGSYIDGALFVPLRKETLTKEVIATKTVMREYATVTVEP